MAQMNGSTSSGSAGKGTGHVTGNGAGSATGHSTGHTVGHGTGADARAGAHTQGLGAPRLVRFFSVEGQRRRMEFSTLAPARAMTPEEETEYGEQIAAQQAAAKARAEAAKAAQKERSKARSRAASDGVGGRAVRPEDPASGLLDLGAAPTPVRSRRPGRDAADTQAPEPPTTRRSGRAATAGPRPADRPDAADDTSGRSAPVARRGVIGASERRGTR